MGLMDILNQVVAAGNSGRASDQHYDQVVQHAPGDVLSAGLAEAFRSDQTPAIGSMVGQLFGNSNGQQQAGMLNQIIASLGPAAAGSLAGGVLGGLLRPGSTQVTPAQASQLSPQQVNEIVTHADQSSPGIADQLASFYSQHSGLVKTLGGAALFIALAKMKDSLSQS